MLEDILKKFSDYKIKPLYSGISNYVFELRREKDRKILKIYRDAGFFNKKDRFYKEIEGYKKASNLGIPTPKIYEQNDKHFYILMEYLGKFTLEKILRNPNVLKERKYKLIENLAFYLTKINSIAKEKNGEMEQHIKSFFEWLEKEIPKVKNKEIRKFIESRYTLLYNLFNLSKKQFREDSFFLLHGDLDFSNILVDKASIKGIIDWEKLHYGHQFEDLAKILRIDIYNQDFLNYLKNTYIAILKVDEEKLSFFKNLYNLCFIVSYYTHFYEYNIQRSSKRKVNKQLNLSFKALKML